MAYCVWGTLCARDKSALHSFSAEGRAEEAQAALPNKIILGIIKMLGLITPAYRQCRKRLQQSVDVCLCEAFVAKHLLVTFADKSAN